MRPSTEIFSMVRSRSRFPAVPALVSFSAVLLAFASNVRASITYDIVDYPTDESGWTVSGTITVDKLGLVDFLSDNNVSATLTVSNQTSGASYTPIFTSISGLNMNNLSGDGYFYATASALYLPVGNELDIGGLLSFATLGQSLSVAWNNDSLTSTEYSATVSSAGRLWSQTTTPLFDTDDPADIAVEIGSYKPWLIATAPSGAIPTESSPVPEPTTLVIWSLLGTIALGLGWSRKRHAA
jgi:hypothetical protein